MKKLSIISHLNDSPLLIIPKLTGYNFFSMNVYGTELKVYHYHNILYIFFKHLGVG